MTFVRETPTSSRVSQALHWAMLCVAVMFMALHFVHLRADFPNDSPWMDWSKYTDEGWYSDAAVRHYQLGHWYLPGDFNPAVALPVWPLLEAAVFHFSGVSILAARALAACCLVAMLVATYVLLKRFPAAHRSQERAKVAAPLAVLFFSANPFFFVFERMAILEPLLATLAVMALLLASFVVPLPSPRVERKGFVRALTCQVGLGLLLAAMVLTKTTAVAIMPAVVYMMWHRTGVQPRLLWRTVCVPLTIAGALWALYLAVLVFPRFWEDYQYLYSANAYTGFQLQPLATVLANTFADGQWMGGVLYSAFFIALMLTLFGRPDFFRNPLVPSLLLWAGGYFLFLAYHNNLQPRYYLLLAVPITMLVALAIEEFQKVSSKRPAFRRTQTGLLWVVSLAILVPDALLELSFVLHPTYSYVNAADAIARIVRTNKEQSHLVLSVSGSDMTLMTGLPSIDDDFGTLDLDQRVRQYKPGWYVAWNDIDDDKMDALTPLYHPVRVAAFPALDDPDRDQLILYRLDPATSVGLARRRRRQTPLPLRTRLGQQPTTTQLQH